MRQKFADPSPYRLFEVVSTHRKKRMRDRPNFSTARHEAQRRFSSLSVSAQIGSPDISGLRWATFVLSKVYAFAHDASSSRRERDALVGGSDAHHFWLSLGGRLLMDEGFT